MSNLMKSSEEARERRSISDEMVYGSTTSTLSHLSDASDSRWISRQSAGRNYSSTSTVYAEHSIKNPNQHQVLFCLATVLQAQIFEDLPRVEDLSLTLPYTDTVFNPHRVLPHPEFDINPLLSPENGGVLVEVPLAVVDKEAAEDPALKSKLLSGEVPLLDSLYRFMCYLQDRAKYPVECNIIALVYLNRITSAEGHILPLSSNNWRAIWASLIILAQKVWDDQPLRTSSFASILPSISRTQLRQMEFEILNILQFNTGVPPSMYARYYFELRTLFDEVIGKYQVDEWRTKPLSIRSAQRLEDRCSRPLHYGNANHNVSAMVLTTTSSHNGTLGPVFPLPLSQTSMLPADQRTASTPSVLTRESFDDVPVRAPLLFGALKSTTPNIDNRSIPSTHVQGSTAIQQDCTAGGYSNRREVCCEAPVTTTSVDIGCALASLSLLCPSSSISDSNSDVNQCLDGSVRLFNSSLAKERSIESTAILPLSSDKIFTVAQQSVGNSNIGSTCMDIDINNNNVNNSSYNPNLIATIINNNPVSGPTHLTSNFSRISLVGDRLGTPREASRTLEDITCTDTTRFVIS